VVYVASLLPFRECASLLALRRMRAGCLRQVPRLTQHCFCLSLFFGPVDVLPGREFGFHPAWTVREDRLISGLNEMNIYIYIYMHKLHCSSSAPFWFDVDVGPPVHSDLVDVTFVDDEALVLLARTPVALDNALDICLKHLVGVFSKFALVINWAPGKSEAMLAYRGHQCQKHYRARCVGGKCSIRLPAQCGEQTLSIVPKYKHLGNDNFDRVTSLGRSTSRILCYVSLCAVVDKNIWIFARWNVAQIPLLAFARSE